MLFDWLNIRYGLYFRFLLIREMYIHFMHDFDRFLAEACDGFFKFESKCLGVKCGRIRK